MKKFIIAASACMALIGCMGTPTDTGGGNSSNPRKTLDINFGGDINRGKVLWEEKKCSQCHGKGPKQGTTWPLDMENLKETTPEKLAEYIEKTMPTFYGADQCEGQCAKDTAQLMVDWVNNPENYLHTADEVETLACKNDVRVERPALTRLSPTEYANTLQDLFDLDSAPDLSHFPVDEVDASFVYLDSVILAHSEAYQQTAENMAAIAAEKINLYANCQLNDNGCAHNYLKALAERAFRGTPSTELMNLILSVNDSVAKNASAKEGVVAAVEAILQSPYFLYRPSKAVGYADNGDAGDQFVNASRLSYLLTGRMPDDLLWNDARSGNLDKNRLLLHADRLLAKDTTLQYLSKEFVARWFQVHKPTNKRMNISAADLQKATRRCT